MAFLFNITNPNDYPIKLDGFVFTVAFEDIDVNMVNALRRSGFQQAKPINFAVDVNSRCTTSSWESFDCQL